MSFFEYDLDWAAETSEDERDRQSRRDDREDRECGIQQRGLFRGKDETGDSQPLFVRVCQECKERGRVRQLRRQPLSMSESDT
jgi:ribosomal protein L44E